jgi:hypothetical protein
MNRLGTTLPLWTWIASALLVLSPLSFAFGQRPDGKRFRHPPQQEREPAADISGLLAQAKGILIVDSEYVPLPLTMHVEEGQLLVNDRPVKCHAGQALERPHPWRASPEQLARELELVIANQIAAPYVIVALADQPLVILTAPAAQRALLCKLARIDAGLNVRPAALRDQLPADLDADVWETWIAKFSPTPEFVSRATAYIENFARVEREAEAALAANRRLNEFSYPLSLVGMIASVLGFGHLLSHRPPVGTKSLDTDTSPLALGVLTWSLALVVVYSALDLTWTILAYQAGQMLELNPLGSRLIGDPLKLIAFKMGATAVSVGLLFYLRKYCKAQLAAWWICLILTLLTGRWLMMSSMFAA